MIASTGLRAALLLSNVELWDAPDCAEVIEELSLTAKAVSGVVAPDIRLGSVDPEDLHERQRGLRSVRKWVDRDGMHCGTWKLPPETGVPFGNRLDTETDRVFREAQQEGRVEPREAYAADALIRMFQGEAKRGGTDMVVVADRSALERGHVGDGEVCHIIGGGPIPV